MKIERWVKFEIEGEKTRLFDLIRSCSTVEEAINQVIKTMDIDYTDATFAVKKFWEEVKNKVKKS